MAGLLILSLALFLGAGALRARAQEGAATLQGTLGVKPGSGPVLVTPKKQYLLSARTTYLFHTLEDRRLRNRELRLAGTWQPSGGFQVDTIFTLHGGKPYRIRYFCETCNIAALGPGRCVCCQQPTELQEYPASEGDNPRPQDVIVIPRHGAR
jgi:hypothetical protein